MIEKPFIARWKEHAPWREFAQVEQDLIISRVEKPEAVSTLLRFTMSCRSSLKSENHLLLI